MKAEVYQTHPLYHFGIYGFEWEKPKVDLQCTRCNHKQSSHLTEGSEATICLDKNNPLCICERFAKKVEVVIKTKKAVSPSSLPSKFAAHFNKQVQETPKELITKTIKRVEA